MTLEELKNEAWKRGPRKTIKRARYKVSAKENRAFFDAWYPEYKSITNDLFNTVFEDINLEIRDAILSGFEWELPKTLGNISIGWVTIFKKNGKLKPTYDYVATRQLWLKDPEAFANKTMVYAKTGKPLQKTKIVYTLGHTVNPPINLRAFTFEPAKMFNLLKKKAELNPSLYKSEFKEVDYEIR